MKYNFIQNNIKQYHLHNYVVHENDNQPMQFYQSEQHGKSSLAPTYNSEYIVVNSISLDAFCTAQHLGQINWMKVDVQGFELYVFKGMRQLLLNKKVDNIIFEFEFSSISNLSFPFKPYSLISFVILGSKMRL